VASLSARTRTLVVLESCPVGRVLFAIVVFGTCAAVVGWYALTHTVHQGTVSVPELIGLNLEEASRLAHDRGLVIGADDSGVFSSDLPPGVVAVQEPHPGFHLKSGSSVRVRLSLGSERVVVPTVRTEPLQSALAALERVGLLPGTRYGVKGQLAGDSVVATDPPAGATVPPRAAVQVLVNVSPRQELWVMPSLLSRPLETVRRLCASQRLRLGQVHDVTYPGYAPGTVLRQYPPAGSPLSRSDIITVWVSR